MTRFALVKSDVSVFKNGASVIIEDEILVNLDMVLTVTPCMDTNELFIDFGNRNSQIIKGTLETFMDALINSGNEVVK
jgi:hypothetical protein